MDKNSFEAWMAIKVTEDGVTAMMGMDVPKNLVVIVEDYRAQGVDIDGQPTQTRYRVNPVASRGERPIRDARDVLNEADPDWVQTEDALD